MNEIKLRFLTIQNRITLETVQEFAQANGLSMHEAKQEMVNKTTSTLQCNVDGQWVDVPHVIQYREQ